MNANISNSATITLPAKEYFELVEKASQYDLDLAKAQSLITIKVIRNRADTKDMLDFNGYSKAGEHIKAVHHALALTLAKNPAAMLIAAKDEATYWNSYCLTQDSRYNDVNIALLDFEEFRAAYEAARKEVIKEAEALALVTAADDLLTKAKSLDDEAEVIENIDIAAPDDDED